MLQGLPVLFAIDRAGVVGGDGPTHAGAYDVTFLRCLPGIVVMTPADENETRQMLYTGFLHDGPCAVRYPRGAGPGVPVEAEMRALTIGRAEERRRGSRIAFLSFGPLLHHVMEAAERLDATVVQHAFRQAAGRGGGAVARARPRRARDGRGERGRRGRRRGGRMPRRRGAAVRMLHLGLPDRFIQHGGRNDMLADAGLDAAGIARSVEEYLALHAGGPDGEGCSDGGRPTGRIGATGE